MATTSKRTTRSTRRGRRARPPRRKIGEAGYFGRCMECRDPVDILNEGGTVELFMEHLDKVRYGFADWVPDGPSPCDPDW